MDNIPVFKRTVADVKCKDQQGKVFIVEMQIEWTDSFMREITDQTREVDPALFEVPEIKEALSLAEEAAYSPAELEAYEEYWKAVSSERTMRNDSLLKGRIEGKAEGKAETKLEIAIELKRKGVPLTIIAECTGLSMAEIESL